MPRNKKTIELKYSGVSYVNADGNKAKADFRHLDNKEAFIASQAENSVSVAADNGKPVRVYRRSRLGEKLMARFFGSSAADDASEFADMLNEAYSVQGNFYTAIVK